MSYNIKYATRTSFEYLVDIQPILKHFDLCISIDSLADRLVLQDSIRFCYFSEHKIYKEQFKEYPKYRLKNFDGKTIFAYFNPDKYVDDKLTRVIRLVKEGFKFKPIYIPERGGFEC